MTVGRGKSKNNDENKLIFLRNCMKSRVAEKEWSRVRKERGEVPEVMRLVRH